MLMEQMETVRETNYNIIIISRIIIDACTIMHVHAYHSIIDIVVNEILNAITFKNCKFHAACSRLLHKIY